MSEELAGSRWVRRTSIDGGWIVACRLCGRSTRKSFIARMTNYAEAEKASRSYAHEHIASAGHQAALRAYQTAKPVEDREEKLLREIFGKSEPSAEALRRREAQRAAAVAINKEDGRRQQAYNDSLPKCAVCGLPVSVREDRVEERVTLPSGALVHVKCVGEVRER